VIIPVKIPLLLKVRVPISQVEEQKRERKENSGNAVDAGRAVEGALPRSLTLAVTSVFLVFAMKKVI